MQNREIEKKFILKRSHGPSGYTHNEFMSEALDVCAEEVEDLFEITSRSDGFDKDIYWKISKNTTLRLREKSGDYGPGELTIKHKDKKSNVNRREENVIVQSFEKALTILRIVHGQEEGTISKFFTKFKFKGGEVAIYKPLRQDVIYLEIEAGNLKTVNKIASRLMRKLDLAPESRSMYELYIRKSHAK